MNNPGATNSGQYTPETLRRRAKLAEALMTRREPIEHWTQGLAQMANAGVGAMMMRDVERKESERNDKFARMADTLLGVRRPVAPETAAPTAPSPERVPMPSPGSVPSVMTPGKVYTNDEPSPLDPPSGRDRDLLARTIVAEAGNQPQVGMDAVARDRKRVV